MKPLLMVLILLGLLAIPVVGCERRRDPTVVLPDQPTAAAEAARIEAYNQQYEQSMRGPAEE
jgi:hypothetical protein